jgi:hypothetical protein
MVSRCCANLSNWQEREEEERGEERIEESK